MAITREQIDNQLRVPMHPRRHLMFTLVLLLSSTGALAAGERTIYYNGKVFTSNVQHLWAQGTVVAVRSSRQLEAE
jgi:hypothetical protein